VHCSKSPDAFADIMSNAPTSDCCRPIHFRVCFQQAVFSRTGCILMISAKASGLIMAANCIAPDLCEKCCFSSYTGCGLHLFLYIRRKNFTVAPLVNIQNDWVYMFPRLYHVAVNQLLRTRLTFSKALMVSVLLLFQSWGAQVWCLWQLLP